MEAATKPRSRSAQAIPAGQIPSPKWLTALPDRRAFGDDVQLTEDERTTLVCIARGFSTREIQARLDVGRTVVARHRSSILRKLDARNEPHAVLNAYQRGVLHV